MTLKTKQILFWTPRILCILFAIFISLFALDVFDEGYGFPTVLLALLMHLLPTAVVVFLLIVTWKREWIAAVIFFLLATLYIVDTQWSQHWASYVSISGTMYVMGIFYLINWIWRKELRNRAAH